MDMEFGYYLEQRYIHSTAMVIARLLTSEDAAALHYEDGFRGIGGNQYTTYVDGFESEEAARRYMRDLHNGVLLEGDDLKDWDAIPTERGILTLILTERERELILTALDNLLESPAGEAEDVSHRCRALTARLQSVPVPEEGETDDKTSG